MLVKTASVIKELTAGAVTSALSVRFDICTCPACAADVTARATAAVHPAADVCEADTIDAITRQVKAAYLGQINHAVLKAIDTVGNNPPHPLVENKGQTFKILLKKILSERGLDFRGYHPDLLKRRFALRIKANQLYSYTEYMKLLDKNPHEYDKLFETLCINVSEFFRDPPVWVTLQYLLDHMISEKIRKKESVLTIWSAGCADGQEAYSVAITASEALKPRTNLVSARIIATDIDKASLARARKARYQADSIKNVNDKLLAKYFLGVEKGADADNYAAFRVREAITSMVTFSHVDLICEEYPANVDLLLCRNVFIYFDRQLQAQILRKFAATIRPGGYLCMGQAESMITEVRALFEDTDSNARIYRRP